MMHPHILLHSSSCSVHDDITSAFDQFDASSIFSEDNFQYPLDMGSEVSKSIEQSCINEFGVSSIFLSEDHFQYPLDMGSEVSKSIEQSCINEFGVSSIFLSEDHFQYPLEMGSQVSKSMEQSSINECEVSSIFFCGDSLHYPVNEEDNLELPSLTEDISMDLDAFDPILGTQIHAYPEQSEESFILSQNPSSEAEEGAWSPSPSLKSSEFSTVQPPPLSLPQEDMEIETQFILPHLLEAHGEARDQNQNALAEEILRCISQKASPLGEDPVERLVFHYSSQNVINNVTENPQWHLLKQEACKNFDPAFKAFYQITPHGKFAHFTANSAILEAIPEDSEVIHIIDFDMGEGLQWPPMIEAISQQNRTLKLTSIKWGTEEENSEKHRRNFIEHARSCGLKLKIEEKSFEDLITELKKLNIRGGNMKRDFLVFNCMVGLPHMGRGRSRRSVMEFINLAESMISKNTCNRGIITFGDGEATEKLRSSLNFRSFFDGNLMHYKALLESIESNFTGCFSQARIAMEFLFVGPYVSSLAWMKNWEELRENCHFQSEIGLGLEGRRLSKGILMEVREMLRGSREGSHEARIEGQNGNQMVLGWNGTQLVRVSVWGN